MRKILFVGHSPNLAGAEYSMLRLIENLPTDTKAIVLAPAGGIFEEKIKALQIDFFSLEVNYAFYFKKKGHGNLPHFITTLKRQVNILHSVIPKPDLVHSNTFFIWEGALLSAFWNIPHVWNLREIIMDSPTWESQINLGHQIALMTHFSDKFICVSNALKNKLPDIAQKKAIVVHNGFETKKNFSRESSREFFEKEFKIPKSAFICLTLGNFIPEKGHVWLLPIAIELLKENPNLYFLWVGKKDGIYSELYPQIKEFEKRIITPGHVNFFNQYMKGADVYLLPSETEAFPTTLLEAQINDVDIVARDCGGAREIIELGQRGTICNFNDKENFKLALLKIIVEEKSTKQSEFVFTMKKMVLEYMDVYNQAILEYKVDAKRKFLLEVFNKNASFFKDYPKAKPLSFLQRAINKLKRLF